MAIISKVYLTKKGKMTSSHSLAVREGIKAKKEFVWNKSKQKWDLNKSKSHGRF